MSDDSGRASPRTCPHIGPFGFCSNTACWNSVNGTCLWLNENSIITTTDNTSDDRAAKGAK